MKPLIVTVDDGATIKDYLMTSEELDKLQDMFMDALIEPEVNVIDQSTLKLYDAEGVLEDWKEIYGIED